MKKLILLMLVTCISIAGFSQVKRSIIKDSTRSAKADFKMKKKFADIDLSKEQKMKMKEMKQANKAKKDAIENDASLSEEQKKAKIVELKKENAGKMQGILTDEQKQKLKEKRKQKAAATTATEKQ